MQEEHPGEESDSEDNLNFAELMETSAAAMDIVSLQLIPHSTSTETGTVRNEQRISG